MDPTTTDVERAVHRIRDAASLQWEHEQHAERSPADAASAAIKCCLIAARKEIEIASGFARTMPQPESAEARAPLDLLREIGRALEIPPDTVETLAALGRAVIGAMQVERKPWTPPTVVELPFEQVVADAREARVTLAYFDRELLTHTLSIDDARARLESIDAHLTAITAAIDAVTDSRGEPTGRSPAPGAEAPLDTAVRVGGVAGEGGLTDA